MKSGEATATKGPIVVEDDVWICYGATILSGVTIGKGSVISAGSIVAKDIPPYSIVINGEVKRTRFSETVIEKMKDVELSLLGEMTDIDNANAILKTDISEDNVDSITSQLVR
jgi:serine acetyltransferase